MQSRARRIVLLSGWFFPDSVGGTEVYVRDLGKELQGRGFDVVVAAPSGNEQEARYVHEGIEVYRYPVSPDPGKQEIRGESQPRHFKIFQRWLDEKEADIVHIHSVTRGCGFFHAQYAKRLGAPVICTVHVPEMTCIRGTMMRWGRVPCDGIMLPYRCAACYLQKQGVPKAGALAASAAGPVMKHLWGRSEHRFSSGFKMQDIVAAKRRGFREFCGITDRIVAVSQWLYTTLKDNGAPPEKLRFCKHGLTQTRRFRAAGPVRNDTGTLRVGYVGRFHPVKGAGVVIEAVKKMPRSLRIELCLYGTTNNEEEKVYREKIRASAGTDPRIRFCGSASEERLETILKSFDCIAVPSVWFETGPFVVLEAFAAGVPVVGSNLGGIAELVTHNRNGILVRAGDAKEWAGVLQRLCTERALARKLAEGIPPDVRTSRDVADDMIELYEEVLG
jgi:glycosyltransferase involved in cell wall biosynthesis